MRQTYHKASHVSQGTVQLRNGACVRARRGVRILHTLRSGLNPMRHPLVCGAGLELPGPEIPDGNAQCKCIATGSRMPQALQRV